MNQIEYVGYTNSFILSEASEYRTSMSSPAESANNDSAGDKQVAMTFTSRLLSEITDFTLRTLGSLPCSIIFAVLVFMIDTTLRSSSAKLYFVCGYFIQLVFFYTFAVISFPKEALSSEAESAPTELQESPETKKMHEYLLQMVPFQQNTTASFYNFSVGYLLGYWGNLNIQKNTPNATLVNTYYAAIVFFCFTFSVFYLKSCSWQSGVVSVAFGIVGGMIWSQIVIPRIQLDSAFDDKMITDDVGTVGRSDASAANKQLPHGVTACDGKNDDMVCRVFRTGG